MPTTKKFISYIRVSTAKQGISGLGLEAQHEAVARYVKGEHWSLIREVVEIESGKRNDRPAIAEALRLCRLHRATLVIAKLDRLARSVFFISSLMESGVEFIAVDFPQATLCSYSFTVSRFSWSDVVLVCIFTILAPLSGCPWQLLLWSWSTIC